MAKMHELLAVESDTQGQFRKMLVETRKVFGNDHLFKGFVRKLEMFDEEQSHLNTVEHDELGTTVQDRLDYTSNFITRYLDIVLQKETTNQKASADLIVNGVVIAENVPATFLLGLESKLKEIREIYEAIPTLDVSVKWEEAQDLGEGVFRQAYPEESTKTKKQFQHQILVEPTEHHPAQIEKWEEQMPVGKYVKENWCSMITSTRKAKLLERIDQVSRAVKKARQRANNTEVEKVNIGKKLMDFIGDA
jgi:archaellum component FlaF (FlaF/FlaG flagellin family)